MQSGGRIRAPSSAAEGATIEVEVGSSVSSVEVSTGGSEQSFPVGSNGKVSIPVPAGTAGDVFAISIGKGLSREYVLVLIIAGSP